MRRYAAALAIALSFTATSRGEESAAAQVKATVAKSLPFIEREGVAWMEGKKCLSCHHTSFVVWSLNRSAAGGLAVDSAKLTEWQEWAVDWKHYGSQAQHVQGEKALVTGSPDNVAQMLLGRRPAGEGGEPAWVAFFAQCLADAQTADGSWTPGGQLPSQKRPKRETQEVSTMWAILALLSIKDEAGAFRPRIDKAKEWLGSETAGKSSEWWAARLLVERALGETTQADSRRKALLERQRADGGWGWLCDDESDALGTGIVLYALARDGVAANDPAIERARAFLVQTQRDDGSWAVKGTKENKKDKVEPTSVFWGTCWAAIGLLESLPQEPGAAATGGP
jgi:squalene-hopene/tetraprenyl-beta-curcumene cyclase